MRHLWSRRSGARLRLAVALVLAVSGTLLVTAAPAASASCFGKGCNGKNPASYCSATSTPEERFIGDDYTIQLRYSSSCGAYWGRAMQDCYYSPIAYVRVQRQIYTPYGYYNTHVYYSPHLPCGGNPAWTPMVGNYGSDRARACLGTAYTWDPPAGWPESWWSWCTDWVY